MRLSAALSITSRTDAFATMDAQCAAATPCPPPNGRCGLRVAVPEGVTRAIYARRSLQSCFMFASLRSRGCRTLSNPTARVDIVRARAWWRWCGVSCRASCARSASGGAGARWHRRGDNGCSGTCAYACATTPHVCNAACGTSGGRRAAPPTRTTRNSFVPSEHLAHAQVCCLLMCSGEMQRGCVEMQSDADR